jgi:hypothetical protein
MKETEWTIMVYMAADNNLAVDMAYAMEQIRRAAGPDAGNPNLFVYYDGAAVPTLYCDFTDPLAPRYLRSYAVEDKLYPVPEAQNENAADSRSVLNFVDWCVNKAPVERDGQPARGRRSRKYALIFSGHSLGFQDEGLFRDETSGKSMTMSDLRGVLQRLVSTREELEQGPRAIGSAGAPAGSDTTVILGQKLDILGFDSCVMGMLEVGHQFSGVARTMIASEGSIPSAGWPYERILKALGRHDQAVEAAAEGIVREYIKSQEPYTVGGISVDIAAWDLGKVKELARAFSALSESLLECFEHRESRIHRQMERALVHVHWKCQSYMFDQNVDLGDFCDLLERECGLMAGELGGDDAILLTRVQERCREVLVELGRTVILSGFCGGAYQYSNGASVFFPWSRAGYEVSRRNYESLWSSWDEGGRDFAWARFLNKYLNEVALRKVEEAPPHGEEEAASGGEALAIS